MLCGKQNIAGIEGKLTEVKYIEHLKKQFYCSVYISIRSQGQPGSKETT